jgi:hypothetical protein
MRPELLHYLGLVAADRLTFWWLYLLYISFSGHRVRGSRCPTGKVRLRNWRWLHKPLNLSDGHWRLVDGNWRTATGGLRLADGCWRWWHRWGKANALFLPSLSFTQIQSEVTRPTLFLPFTQLPRVCCRDVCGITISRGPICSGNKEALTSKKQGDPFTTTFRKYGFLLVIG